MFYNEIFNEIFNVIFTERSGVVGVHRHSKATFGAQERLMV